MEESIKNAVEALINVKIHETKDEKITRERVAVLLWHISSMMASNCDIGSKLEADRIKVDKLAIEIANHAGMDFNDICDKYNNGLPI